MLKFNIPITGIIENMSYFQCDKCSEPIYIFGKNGAEDLAKQFNTKVIAKLPIINENEDNLKQKTSNNQKKDHVFNDLVKRIIN